LQGVLTFFPEGQGTYPALLMGADVGHMVSCRTFSKTR